MNTEVAKIKINRFIKTAFVFLTGNMLSKLVSFFLLPMYTNEISPEQFGNYDVAMSFINLIAPIAFFQIWDGMYRYAFDYKEKKEKQAVISNSTAVCFGGLLVYLALFSLLQIFLKLDYFIYVLIYGVLYAVHYNHTYAARVYLSNVLFVASGTAATLVTAVCNIVLILGFGFDVKAIYISSIIGILVQILMIEIKVGVFRHFNIKVLDKALIKKMLRFSVPLCVATVSYWLLSGLTKIFIQNQEGEYANGLYAVANKFGGLITLLVSVVQFAWNETAYIMTEATPDERIEKYSFSMNLMSLSVIYGSALLCVAIKLIFPYIIGTQYSAALALIPATVLGVGANALAGFSATIFMAEKQNAFITVSTFTASVINIIGGYFATKLFGLHGAIIALAVSFLVLYIMRIVRLKVIYKIKTDILSVFLGLLILAVSVWAFYRISSAMITVLIGFAVIFAGGFLSRKYIAGILPKRRRKNEID